MWTATADSILAQGPWLAASPSILDAIANQNRDTPPARALAGVSLELGDGICGLLGPNRAGKTTLMRVLAPDGGTVRLLGRDPADRAERPLIRGRLGYFTSASRRSSSSTTSRSSST